MQRASRVTEEKNVASVSASTLCAARHGTTLKWSFAVNCKALDGVSRVGTEVLEQGQDTITAILA